MYCPKCGAQNDDSASWCVGCNEPLRLPATPAGPYQDVPSYLVQAILVTLLCCMPFGVVAIVFAAQVSAKLQSGDYGGAVRTSRQARMWCWLSFGLGLGPMLIWLLFVFFGMLAGFAS